ncbi:MAG TPA: bifunctional [glutamine synthetase] adenylyltransferase/[glutamine synthetase]-adenylyl-L-tyrosine phosphorylase [Stellaceae bacterium]|nr:bifunctional [glutamine synthetase] adenylyltransferase/[glutamine synthetase]-adenylyl-L-tyrosine phosphorylase [Stellaceae bacterium]
MVPLLLDPSFYRDLPLPASAAAADTGFARWHDAAAEQAEESCAAFMRDLADDTDGRRLLASLFGNSPFLTQCCLSEPPFLMRLLHRGHDATFAELLGGLNHDLAGDGRAAVMSALRIARRRAALLIALADLGGLWPLDRVTRALSEFAEAALGVAVRHLLAGAAAAGELVPRDAADPERDSGFIVLGMGKLGGYELNYSSDIDLILLYDAERLRYAGRRGVERCCTLLAHDLVRILGERTGEGYVFRTDLRLRPDPGSTPPVVSRLAALSYYESAGQNWERAALIKARPVAGDRAAGAAFLGELTPFLWRKHLDFAAIEDIHSIKRQIDAHRGGGRIRIAGHNVKLGRGGIREIEFFAQTQQLIWGGRMPELRTAATCDTLAALAQSDRIADAAATDLTEAYGFLRRVEHRLQMVDDAQTHTLPADAEGLRRFATFMGFASSDDFAAALTRHLVAVERHYARLFEEAPTLAASGNLVFTGVEDDPETLETIRRLGFADPPAIAGVVRGWHHGRYRATRSQRARELLTELVPTLLKEFGASANPDAAFIRFNRLLAGLPAGVQLFSLFYNNPPLVALLAEIMGTGPRLADEIARRPGLLDGVLAPGFLDPLPPLPALASDLARMLAGARHYEEVLGLARRWVGERKFQVGVQILRHRLDGEAAGGALADIAEAALAALLPCVAAEFAKSHGRVDGGALVVLGLGKLGSREMTLTSDLDLILIYDAPAAVEASDGPRPLAVPTYYARLCQRLVNALTALSEDGVIYEIDMRLRPSGTQGPIASSLAAFRRYHDELAWTWEQMSLTRARAVAGPPALATQAMAIVIEVLARPRDPDRLVVDVAEMRERIAEQHRVPPPFDLKYRRGGMIDIEFIAQYLQLREAARRPAVLHQNTRAALLALEDADALAPAAAGALLEALALWRDLQSMLRLTAEEPFDAEAAAAALKALIAQGVGAVDFAALEADMEAKAARALAWYDGIVATPAAAARAWLETAATEEEESP